MCDYIPGPRDYWFTLTQHVVERWGERFGNLACGLPHAVQWSRIALSRRDGRELVLWFDCEAIAFVATRCGPCRYRVVTCYRPVGARRRKILSGIS